MKLSLKRRPTTPAEAESAVPASDQPAGARQLLEADLTGKAIAALIVLSLLSGPAGLFLWSTSSSAPAQAAGGQSRVDLAAPARAGDFAVRVVEAWAAATRDDDDALARLAPGADAAPATQDPVQITSLAVASVKQVGKTWAVTVSGVVDGEVRYFGVPVTVAADSVSALALPAPVAGPAIVQGTPLDYSSPIATTSPITATVSEFLTAYLTGAGELERYTTPGTNLSAVTPALASSVAVSEVRLVSGSDVDPEAAPSDGKQLKVLVAASLTLDDNRALQTIYALSLTGRADRWEITAIDPAPAVRAVDPLNVRPRADDVVADADDDHHNS